MPIVQRIRKLLFADIVKVFSLNAISTLVKMLTGMISVKVVSSIIGPSGIALLGQLHNFTSIVLAYSNGGISGGITKFVAEKKYDQVVVKRYISIAIKITLLFTFAISFFLIVFHSLLSQWIFLSDEYGYVFIIFGLTLVLYSFNTLLLSVLNGYKEFKKYVYINIVGTVFGLVFNVGLVILFGLHGALISAVTFQSVVFFVTLWMCRHYFWLKFITYKGAFNKEILRQYAQYSLMAIVASTLGPLFQIVLRGYVISNISATEAGYWEAMNRISSMYLMVITTSFSIYYLPRLSEIKDIKEMKHEILKCYKFIIPVLVIGTIFIYLFRNIIIWILFSPEFYPMESLFAWQLSGDVIKIASWLLAYVMVAKAMTKLYIISEVFFSSLFLLLGLFFVRMNGIIGLTQAYLLNYLFYFITLAILFRYLYKFNKI